METSRIGAAQDGLKTALVARAGLVGVPLSLGFPAAGLAPEHVWVSGNVDERTVAPETTASAAGLGPRDERFVLVVRVFVHRSEAEYLPARNRALELAAEIEAAVAANPQLGGAVALAFPVGGRMEEAVREDGRDIGVEIRVACRAQLAG